LENKAKGLGHLFPQTARWQAINDVLWGKSVVVDDWYIAAYEPLKGKDGSVIGALYVGVKEQSAHSFKGEIKGIQVGDTGYVYIMDSEANLKVHPTQEGGNIIDSKFFRIRYIGPCSGCAENA
jgi:hypothetical protein